MALSEMTVDATIENVTAVTDFVNEQLEAADCPIKLQMQISVAIDEIFSNIAYYAYAPEVGTATVCVDTDGSTVTLTFADRGKPYNPLAKEDPDITLSSEERQIGGLGIFMVKKMASDMKYEYKDGQNLLHVIFNY